MATRQGDDDELSGPRTGGGEGATLPPRTPSTYALTDHVRGRLGQPGRYLSVRIISEAVRRGQLRWNATDGWRFALVVDGVRFVVVVAEVSTDSPVVVTGWTELADRTSARGSDRWSRQDVDIIGLRSDLSEHRDRHVPSLIRPRVVERPVAVGNHHVTTTAGAGYVDCGACGDRFSSKADLEARPCRR